MAVTRQPENNRAVTRAAIPRGVMLKRGCLADRINCTLVASQAVAAVVSLLRAD